MATFNGHKLDDGNIFWFFSDLEHDQLEYDLFHLVTDDGIDYSWNGYADLTTFHDCAPGFSVTGSGWATWAGVEYFVGTVVVPFECTPDPVPEDMPYVNASFAADTWVTLDWPLIGFATSYNISWSGGSASVGGPPYTVTGLSLNTGYTFSVSASNDSGSGGAASAYLKTRPDYFVWPYTIASGLFFQNQVPAAVWNGWLGNLEAVFMWYYYQWNGGSGAPPAFDYKFSGENFNATDFNASMLALNGMGSYTTYSVNPGDWVYASYLQDLATFSNSVRRW